MGKFFVNIYDYFSTRKALMFSLLAASLAAMLYFAAQVRFEEDVTSFFPDGKDQQKTMAVFKNLKAKDKIFVLFSFADPTVATATTSFTDPAATYPAADPFADPDKLIEASRVYQSRLLEESVGKSHIAAMTSEIDEEAMTRVTDFIYDNLPIFLSGDDYVRLDSMFRPDAFERRMEANYNNLVSPIGIAVKNVILKDPLGMGSGALSQLQAFGQSVNYEIYDGHIFSGDMSTMLIMIDPVYGAGSTGKNDALIAAMESVAEQTMQEFGDVNIEYCGGPGVGVYNARQIKQDTMITLTIALLIIFVFITFAFRSRWSVVLMVLPVLYGAVFALAMIYIIKGQISSIAIGAGAAVFGIAMSYSIHVLSHRNHTRSIRRIIEELAYPLTVGSFTTIGAFTGLLFTSSNLLRDFGLFAALTLVGTTLFTLIFLPHLMREQTSREAGKTFKWIERINSYEFDKNRWLVGGIAVITIVCLFTYNDVRFDSDMMHLSVEPGHIKRAENKLNDIFNSDNKTVLFVSANSDMDSAVVEYGKADSILRSLQNSGQVESVISAKSFLIPSHTQMQRIERWNNFWTPQKQKQAAELIRASSQKLGFTPQSFAPFTELISKTYAPLSLTDTSLTGLPVFKDMITPADSLAMLITKVGLSDENKEYVYGRLGADTDIVIVDQAYFSNKMAVVVNNDFYLVLYLSSFLIFFALLISYGRIELAALAFVPMALSWIIILGLMAILGIEFNIVNIILSTFIFGIGDDFSIFIMDGLLSEYKTGKKLLPSHKTAIFFSAFTTVIGMGALVFAGHPALKSISVISILGMIAVVLISFTIQPILFRMFISSQTRKGGFPYTLTGLLNSLYAFISFMLGCFALQGLMLILIVLPISKKRKKYIFHSAVSGSTRFFLKTMITTRRIDINAHGEDFKKPAVIISNHQSFIDILVLLGMNRKSVMVTNGWVWRSPFFGRIVRYADFFHTADGYESLALTLKDKVADGYSVIVFPEGTRSADNKIKRFHKGAFYLADILKLDIIPVVQFGNGLVSSKRQPFFIKKGFLVSNTLPRIKYEDTTYGTNYKDRTKNIAAYFRSQYDLLCMEYGVPENPYYYDALIKNYTYKGPVLEWYMRIKIRMEGNYKFFDDLLPRTGVITDIGCGYGSLAFMLSLLSDERTVLGIDYDREKTEVANHSFLRRSANVKFIAANALEYDLPASDAFIMNDILHYMDHLSQRELIERCISKLNPQGVIVIREGDNSQTERHKITKLTEIFSTEIFKFNKTEGRLCFTSAERIYEIARSNNMSVEQVENDRQTSNTIFILRNL